MKFKIFLSFIFLVPISLAQAETPVAKDSQQVCANRINSFKTALKAQINANKNVDEAKEQLDKINKLPNTLSPCEKQKQIPALSSDETLKQTNEAQEGRETNP